VSGDAGTIESDYAQHELGDVVFVELPAVGTKIRRENLRHHRIRQAVSELYAPVSGEVIETNAALSLLRKTVNPPHGAACVIKVKLAIPQSLGLMERRRIPGVISEKEASADALFPKSPASPRNVASIGERSYDDLFASIPEQFRLKAPLRPSRPTPERNHRIFRQRQRKTPAATRASWVRAFTTMRRSDGLADPAWEFLTSYTPYQLNQPGHAATIFEFQTLMCERPDGGRQRLHVGRSTAQRTVLMASAHGRQTVIAARSLHPEYRRLRRKRCRPDHQGTAILFGTERSSRRSPGFQSGA